MATFLSLYNEIEYKLKQAALCIKELRARNYQLEEENETLKAESEQLQKSVEEWKKKYNLLSITNVILKKEDKQETKKKLNDWAREIDKCIEILSK